MASHALADAFESAKNEFLSQFPEGTPDDFEQFTSIDDVYNAAEAIQLAQSRTRMTRNLGKIRPFLECLRHYGEVIETFVTVKADVLALIWGPIKFLLLTSSTYINSFDKLVGAMAQIGQSLPAFEKYADLFRGNQPIQQVLCLFYKDILDFYWTLLQFFKRKGWTAFFDALWPKSAGRIHVITENIERHKILMQDSITLVHVVEAHTACQNALKEFERQHEFRQGQDWEAVKLSLSPVLYDRDLERLKTCRAAGSGSWLFDQEEYGQWSDPFDKTARLLWLQGIPGAGKTFLSSSIIENIASRSDPKMPQVFAFLDYQSRESISALQLLHSFIWQMALDYENLQEPLILAHKRDIRRLSSDVGFVKDLFSQFLDLIPTMFIVIDGLDEILQPERRKLLRTMIEILREKSNVKILISSRPEDDISRILSKEAQPIRVHDCNNHDIEAYVEDRASSLAPDVEPGLAQEIADLMKAIPAKAEGMFLYARLVCDNISQLGDIDAIKEAVDNLPDGLHEAYERILSRITEDLGDFQREEARQILALVTCCVVPLSKKEIQLAVYIAQGRDPSKGCKGLFMNILERCGPILEEFDGKFRFVHFSAREYLLSRQSKRYLTEPTAHTCVALICIKYLSSTCFDLDIDEDALSMQVRSGAFVLLSYVCSHWLYHIGQSGRKGYQTLKNDIKYLINTRTNPNYAVDVATANHHNEDWTQRLADTEEDVTHKLDNALVFSAKRSRDLSFDQDEEWKLLDPFTFTETEARFRHKFESMLCERSSHQPDCPCQAMKAFYGSGLYKCDRPGCVLYRIGFDTQNGRDEHTRRHTRPFKCEQSDCPYAFFGFATENSLKLHAAEAHARNLSDTTLGWVNVSGKELKDVLMDAVKESDVSTILAAGMEAQDFALDLLLQAYRQRSSDAMIKHLLDKTPACRFHDPEWDQKMGMFTDILRASIRHGNIDVFLRPDILFMHWATYSSESVKREILKLIGDTRRADLIEAVSQSFYDSRSGMKGKMRWNRRTLYTEVIPQKADTSAEILALECFERVKSHLSKYANYLLARLGARCCSIDIAEFLLANGADINCGELPLHELPIVSAARKRGPEAAEFVEYLVRNGSRTNIMIKDKHLSEFRGPTGIKNWIGITWEELIEQATHLL